MLTQHGQAEITVAQDRCHAPARLVPLRSAATRPRLWLYSLFQRPAGPRGAESPKVRASWAFPGSLPFTRSLGLALVSWQQPASSLGPRMPLFLVLLLPLCGARRDTCVPLSAHTTPACSCPPWLPLCLHPGSSPVRLQPGSVCRFSAATLFLSPATLATHLVPPETREEAAPGRAV